MIEAKKLLPHAEETATVDRDREEIVATIAPTLSRLKQLKIDGREFLEHARLETDNPLLTLKGEALEQMAHNRR